MNCQQMKSHRMKATKMSTLRSDAMIRTWVLWNAKLPYEVVWDVSWSI